MEISENHVLVGTIFGRIRRNIFDYMMFFENVQMQKDGRARRENIQFV